MVSVADGLLVHIKSRRCVITGMALTSEVQDDSATSGSAGEIGAAVRTNHGWHSAQGTTDISRVAEGLCFDCKQKKFITS